VQEEVAAETIAGTPDAPDAPDAPAPAAAAEEEAVEA
jgi:hypothetical protein